MTGVPFGEVLDPDTARPEERADIRLARSMTTEQLRVALRNFGRQRRVLPSDMRRAGAMFFVLSRREDREAAEPVPPGMTTDEWIAHIDAERQRRSGSTDNAPLAAGNWHGYGHGEDQRPMKGRYMLIRWERPTVAVSHDDPGEAKRLARLLESALEPGATALRVVTALQGGGLLITPAEKSVAYRLVKEALGG